MTTAPPALAPGLTHTLHFRVPASKMVPALYPESAEFAAMPEVFATGFLVGLLEWACVRIVNPSLDLEREISLGTHIDVSHAAATPAGRELRVVARLIEVAGRRLTFEVEADDGEEVVSRGRHQRVIVDRRRFDDAVSRKRTAPR